VRKLPFKGLFGIKYIFDSSLPFEISMKISLLHFAGPPVIGGVESVMGHHARLMADAGHDVSIIAGRGESVDTRVSFIKMPLIDSKDPQILKLKEDLDKGVLPENFKEVQLKIFKELQKYLKSTEVLFVHNVFTMAKNLPLTAALRELAKENSKLKIVAWHHDLAARSERYQDELFPKWPWNLMTSSWGDINIKHVAVSEMRRNELAEYMNLDQKEVTVVPSGVDEDRLLTIDPKSRKILNNLNVSNYFPLLLLPVRITRRKNIELAVRIISELSKHYPHAALIVTGPPGAHNIDNSAYFNELRSLSAEFGLNDGDGSRVFFLAESVEGFLPDAVIADLYKTADCLLITSIEEGFGIPIIEAALSRLPIFCSELPPFKEIADLRLNYFQLNDPPKDIAASIAKHINEEPSYILRKEIRDSYSWTSVYQNLIKPLLEN